MPLHDDYTVRLDAFQGPLDLLLYLIRRAEVDIHDIPVHAITEQYFEFLRQIEHVDIDLAGEFLVMAATLIEIKSRTLAPRPRKEGGEEGASEEPAEEALDPRHELVQQLLAYQRYRLAAETLEQRREEFLNRFAARVPEAGELAHDTDDGDDEREAGLELEDAHILDLFDAYERIVGSIDFTRLGEHRVEYDDTPIALHQEDLLDQLRRAPNTRLSFRRVFEGRTRIEAIGLFLAMLELARQRLIRVEQELLGGDIEIVATEGDPEGSPESVADMSAEAPDGVASTVEERDEPRRGRRRRGGRGTSPQDATVADENAVPGERIGQDMDGAREVDLDVGETDVHDAFDDAAGDDDGDRDGLPDEDD